MAQVQLQPATAGRTRQKIHSFLKIDMTPMVDLGFLLITFFIFTTTMTDKNVTRLIMPKEEGKPIDVPASKSMTVLLGSNNKVFVYEGLWDEAKNQNKISATDYNEYKGLGNLIRAKQKQLQSTAKENDGPIVLIKPLEHSSYQNVIDALDEMTINGITKYAIVDATQEEKAYINRE